MSLKTTRRKLLAAGAGTALAPSALAARQKILYEDSIYQKLLGVRPILTCRGHTTAFGGSLMPPEVLRAMQEANDVFIDMLELQAAAGKRIARIMKTESAMVSAGSFSAMLLGCAACLTGKDPAKIDALPHPAWPKREVVIQKAHRNGYDHAFRMVGLKLVEAETADEVRHAINDKTAGLAMVLSHNSIGHKVELDEMIDIAHRARLPLILDAAAEVPPPENLSKFVRMGADLVAFSGGKNIRGPQCSGILMGRKDLIEAAYVNSSPNNHFARIAKVGKEEIVGLLVAVELCLKKDHAAERREWTAMLERIATRLRGIPSVKSEFIPNLDYSHSPRLSVQWDEAKLGITLDQMVKRLRSGEPAIEASDMTKFRPAWKGLGIFPYNLKPGEEIIIADRVKQILRT